MSHHKAKRGGGRRHEGSSRHNEAFNIKETSAFFMQNSRLDAGYVPAREARAREQSLQKRNEELAVEIGVLIGKTHRLQSVVRALQRRMFVPKSDSCTQTDPVPASIFQEHRASPSPAAMPARSPRKSIRQTYISPAVVRKTDRHSNTDFLSPLALEGLTISDGGPPPLPVLDSSPSPARRPVAQTPERSEDAPRSRRRTSSTPMSYKEPSLRAKVRKGHRLFAPATGEGREGRRGGEVQEEQQQQAFH